MDPGYVREWPGTNGRVNMVCLSGYVKDQPGAIERVLRVRLPRYFRDRPGGPGMNARVY